MANKTCAQDEICTEGKLLALNTAIVCLARSLALSGDLNRELFRSELQHGLDWLRKHEEIHASQAFESILPMLRDV